MWNCKNSCDLWKMGKYRVSMGIGGTFTDLIALDEQNGEELKKAGFTRKL